MGRAPCCEKVGLKKGRWTAEEDEILLNYIKENGEGSWRSLPKNAGLLRCGKSCRLRWINYLRADLKKGDISSEEEELIIKLHAKLGNRWSLIAGHLPGRTDNEIKNHWNSHLSRRIDTFWRFSHRPTIMDHNNNKVKVMHRPTIMDHNNNKVKVMSYRKRRTGRTSRASMKKKTCLDHPRPTTNTSSHSSRRTSSTMASTITDQEVLTNGGLTLEEDELESEIMSWLEVIQCDDQDLGICNNMKDDEINNTIETRVDESNEQKMKEAVTEGGEEEDWFLGFLDDDEFLEFDQGLESDLCDSTANCWEHDDGDLVDQTLPMESLEDWLFSDIF